METTLPPIERKNKILFIAGTIFFITLTLALILIFVSAGGLPKTQTKTITPVTKKTTSPTPTPLQKNQITFEVLNGSGIAGMAARGAQTLTTKGYTVIKIGNAEVSSTATQLLLAADAISHEDEILADLQADFPTATLSGQLTDSTASARLIIGKE